MNEKYVRREISIKNLIKYFVDNGIFRIDKMNLTINTSYLYSRQGAIHFIWFYDLSSIV